MLHSAPFVTLSKRVLSIDRPQKPPGFWRASTLTHPAGERGSARKRLKFFIRAWLTPKLTRDWLQRLASSEIAPLWMLRPRLASKLQRPYHCARWSPQRRLEALQAHYAVFPRLVQASARAEIYSAGCTLLRIRNAETERELQIRLFYRDQFEKEGELTLGIFDQATDTMLAGVTFSIGQRDDTRTALIGGLQASPGPQTRTLIHDVAKEMHGMRPKAFALWCLQALLTRWNVTELRAVGDEQHIYCHWRKRRQIAASYNEFWQESDGELGEDGLWVIPLQPRVRAREELKPSRRKAHERRYALLGKIDLHLSAAAALLAVGSGAEMRRREGLLFEYRADSSPLVALPGGKVDEVEAECAPARMPSQAA